MNETIHDLDGALKDLGYLTVITIGIIGAAVIGLAVWLLN